MQYQPSPPIIFWNTFESTLPDTTSHVLRLSIWNRHVKQWRILIMKKFLTREKILADLLSMRIQDGGLVTVSVEALSQCSREMDAARHVARPIR